MKYKLFPWLIGFLLLLVIFFASFGTPTITQLDPAAKQNKVTFNASFALHFSHIMHRGSVEDAFMLLPKAEGDFRWKDFRTLEFIPDKPLTIGDKYRIVIKGEAKSIWMKKIGFDTTIDYLVTGPPYVLFVDPSQGSVITKSGAITVMFDRPMDWDEVSEKDLIQIQPSLSGEVRFFGMSAFQFIPKKVSSDRTFEVTIPAGLSALDGGKTDEDYSWIIMSPDLKVEKSEPESGADQVAVNESIRINFDNEAPLEGIKPGVNALLYPSNDLDSATVKKMDGFFNTEVTYHVDEDGKSQKNVLVFAPTFPYQPDESYRFVLKSDKDLHLEEDFELEFKTVDATDEVEEEAEDGDERESEEPVIESSVWEDDSMDFFIRGENPRLKLDRPLVEPAVLSACQVSSNEFMRRSAKHSWNSYKCDTDSVTINPSQKDLGLVLNLDDYFNIDWVTGVYFASITRGEKKAVKHFLIEDTTLLMKRSDSDLLIWALDVKSGEPISDMELEILSYDGEELARGKTDEMGVFSIDRAFDEGVYVRGKKEDDGIVRWGFVSDSWILSEKQGASSSEDFGLYVLLNQNVFSPGERIKIKGIWRELKDHVLALPESTQVTVTIEDLKQNFIISKRIPLRRNGSFDGSIVVPEESVSGHYLVSVADLNQQRLASPIPIQVKDDSSDLKLEWIEAKKDHAVGTTPVYIVKARYENGIPAARLKGRYELFQKPSALSYQKGSVSYTFGGLYNACAEDCQERTLISSEDLEFDLNGEAKLLLTDSNDKFLSAGNDYELHVVAQLPGREPININRSFEVHQGNFDLGLGLKHALINVNETIEASVLALNYAGEMEAEKKVKLSLVTQNQKEKTVYEESLMTASKPSTTSIPIDPRMEDGVYLLRAESQDDKRNKILVEQLVYISTNPTLTISDELLLAPDQKKYFVGGRAHLLINEPDASEDNPVPVLVTYERDGLLGHETLSLNAPVTRITVPIKESMMPHFLVTVTRFYRGITPSFSSSSQKIGVGNDESRIFVDLSYEPELVKPGEEVTFKLKTYDYQNRPLSSVLTLNLLTGEPQESELSYDSFYPPQTQPLNAASNISLDFIDQLPDLQSSYDALLLNSNRSKYFDPLIATSVGGEAEVIITLPEKKEDLHIQVIATKDSQQFGTLSSVLKMNQQLQIQPILPSFTVPGDQTIFAASVKNISDKSIQSRLEFISSDVTNKGDSARNFSLKPGQQTEIVFNVFVDSSLEKEEIEVKFRSGGDLTEAKIPLRHLKSCMKVANTGLLEDIWTGRINLHKAAYPNLGSLQLTMGGGPMAFGKVQAEALEDYVHESTYLLTAKLLSKLSFLPDSPTEDDLASVRSLVVSLLKSADERGAYRFWSEPAYSPTLSALVLLAYTEASSKGIHIDSIQLNRTIDTLWKALDVEGMSLNDKLFILWVLGKGEQFDTKRALEYFQERELATIRGNAFLLMNLDQLVQAGQTSVATLFDTLKAELVDKAIQEDDMVYFDSSSEITAIVLYALSELDSANPLLEPMANYLVFQGGGLIRELDPEEALWTIMGLKSYFDQTDTSATNYIAQVKLNGTLVLDQSVTGNSADEIYQTKVEAKLLNTDDINDIFVKKEGTGPLYLDAHLTSYLDPSQTSRVEDGIIVVRQLYEITDEGGKIIALTFRKGKNYLSELEVIVPKDYRFVALSDEIPAGMKINSGTLELSEPFTQSSVKDSHVTYYAPYLSAGVYRISTELQAILPGIYLHLPATIQAIFEPVVMSRTEGGFVQIID